MAARRYEFYLRTVIVSLTSERSERVRDSRDFKICDATVTKTSFKIASSGLLIFFVVMSACLTSKN